MAFAFFPVFEAMLSLFEETRPRQMCPGGADVSRVHRAEVIRRAGADQADHLRAVLVACVLREDGEGSAVVIRLREVFAERGVRICLRFFRFGPAAFWETVVLCCGGSVFCADSPQDAASGRSRASVRRSVVILLFYDGLLSVFVRCCIRDSWTGISWFTPLLWSIRTSSSSPDLTAFLSFLPVSAFFLSERPCARAYLMLYSKQKAGQP